MALRRLHIIVLALLAYVEISASVNVSQSFAYVNETSLLYGQSGLLEWLVTIIFPTTTTTTTTTTTSRPSQATTTTTAAATTTPSPRQCEPCVCGIANSTRRIVGGQAVQMQQYPWITMIEIYHRFYCGAALISDRHVATAAHCVDNVPANLIGLRFLEHSRRNSSAAAVLRNASAVLVHAQYDKRNYDNDIALIRFEEALNITAQLRPICLPMTDYSFAGETAVAAGWGTLSEGGYVADELQEVNVTVLSQSACRETSYAAHEITENMLCAGVPEGGKDSCQGDSGGPLQVLNDNNNNNNNNDTRAAQYQLAGIVSWGEGCGRPNAPGVYTRVSQYRQWIAQHTAGDCYCSYNVAGSTEPPQADNSN